ncbi:MAG: hypothetical protein LBK69_01200 [Syntrophomonadaceae bacterium]|nr:hypothetical protein [Syntrophomonadaceae bacterium]
MKNLLALFLTGLAVIAGVLLLSGQSKNLTQEERPSLIGTPYAQEIMDEGITLEEYVERQ